MQVSSLSVCSGFVERERLTDKVLLAGSDLKGDESNHGGADGKSSQDEGDSDSGRGL